MVLFHVGGVRDSLAQRAEFARENQVDKWQRQQHRLAQRRASKERYWSDQRSSNPQIQQVYGGQTQFGIPNDKKEEDN